MDCSEVSYIQRLVGQPYQRNGLHCWALVIQVQRDLFGRELPLIMSAVPMPYSKTWADVRHWLSRPAEEYGWQEADHPQHGCVVRMHRPHRHSAEIDHVGVYFDIDGGVVLHTDDPHGVVLDTLSEIRSVRNYTPRFFVPVD